MRPLLQFITVLRRLAKDERGSILILFVLFMVAFLAFAGLALDSARVMMVNNDLQQLADAAALAAANKMDGTTSLTVADNAARSLSNTPSPHLWNTAGAEISSVTFYPTLADANAQTNALPESDSSSPAQARFVRVNTGVWGITPMLLRFAGTNTDAKTRAAAIAGWSTVACKVQPLMLCNPNEPGPFTASPGELFGFSVTGNNTFGPGDFALLDPAGQTHSSANQIEVLLSQNVPNFCYVDTVSPAQGQKTSVVAAGINARFDITPASTPTGMDLTPGPNNLKGVDNSTCLNDQQYSTNGGKVTLNNALPLNTGMTISASNPVVGGSFDTSAAADYMAAHHGGASWPVQTDPKTGQPVLDKNGKPIPITRYQMYLDELDPANSLHTLSGTSNEKLVRTPNTCSGIAPSTPTNADRRVITVAIVNCLSQNLSGNSTKVLFSNQYAQFFLVRPVTNGSGGTDGVIFAEFIKYLDIGDKNGPHHLVQLYQ